MQKTYFSRFALLALGLVCLQAGAQDNVVLEADGPLEDGETPSLRPVAPDGERFPDGSYQWELRAINPAEQDDRLMTRRAPARTRQIRTERGTFERRVGRRSVVASGSFQIENGGFVMPRLDEESEGER